ncbi:MAG: PKD domain-containing protein [Saprospiraceae bacterium]
MNTKINDIINGGRFWRKQLFIITLLTLPLQIFASHIVGGEISYRCLGGNEYEVTLDVYRDCFYGAEDAQFDEQASVGIFNLDDNQLFTELKIDFIVDDTLNAILNDPCLFVPGDVCVHTTRYRDTISLPMNMVGYKFVYQRCCRNETISNIYNPDLTGATYEIDLIPAAMESCNSSPRFQSWPPIFICINKPIFFDHSASDFEGDSLVYKLCTPNQGATESRPDPNPPNNPPYNPVVFIDPVYNLDNLLGAGQPLRINPRTGRLTGLPTLQGQFVVGVCVEEYRDGVLISETRRDFQYNVGRCEEVEAVIVAPAAQCENLTVEFSNNSVQADEFEWHFDYPNDPRAISSEANPTYTYPDTGRYTVMLIAEPGSACVDTSFAEVYLQNNSLFVDFEIEKADCSSSSVLGLVDFSTDAVSGVANYFWEVTYNIDTITSREQNPVIGVPLDVQGTVTLTVTSVNGCVRSLTKTFETGQEDPGSELADTLYVCFGDSIQLNPDAPELTSYNYSWMPSPSLDDPTIANPTAYVEENTTFTVMVSPNNDLCSFEEMVTVVVLDRPQLDFSTDTSCEGTTVTFNNNSAQADRYTWDFGDENSDSDTSNLSSPSYTYPDMGTYQVTLIADTLGRCADTLVQPVVLTERTLNAAIEVDYADCSAETIVAQFSDISTNSLNNTVSRQWTFSTGETFTEIQPTLEISSDQTVTATLTITTEEGCTVTTTDSFDFELFTGINIAADASICAGASVALNPNGNTAYQYNWSPATGLDNPTAANPTATPEETTTYTVTITNISADTCELTRTVTINVNANPDLEVNADVATCDTEAIIFATSTDAINIEYLSSNGEVLASGNNSFTVPVSGSTDYMVRATAANGCTTEMPINISGGPAEINIDGNDLIAFCQGESLTLSVTNNDPNDILTYVWEPASDIISGANTSNPTISEAIGERTFFVAATNQFNCTASDSVTVVVIDTTFQLGFTSELQCDGQTVNFTNTSTNAFGYAWNFGDGRGTSTEENPSYIYSESGTYEVYLTLQYDVDCTDTIRQQVEIFEPNLMPAFAFDYENCDGVNTTIQFTNQTTTNLTGVLEYNWTFSNGESSNEENPSITLGRSQELIAELCVTSSNNCMSCMTDSLNVTVVKLDLAEEFSICPSESVQLNPNGDPDLMYQWSPVEGLDDPTAANPIASPMATTEYTVTVQNFSADTCQITQSVLVNVAEEIGLSVSPNSNTNDVTTCGEDVVITAMTTLNGASFKWTDANGNIISEGGILTINPDNSATYYITAEANGCTETDSITIINNGIETSISIGEGGTAGGENQVCENSSFELIATNNRPEQMVTYSWTAGNNGTIIQGADTNMPTVTVIGEGTATFYLDATNEFDCTFRDSIVVEITPFEPNISDAVTACPGEPTALNPMGNPDYEYVWSPTDGLDNANIPNPTITVSTDQIYNVVITSGSCSAEASVAVNVADAVSLLVSKDTVVCDGTAITLFAEANVAANYEWSQDPDFTELISTDSMVTIEPEGEQTYFIRAISQADNCMEMSSINVNNAEIQVELAPQFNLCADEETELTMTNLNEEQELNYFWSPAELIDSGLDSNSPTVSPTESTSYTVEVENQFGCFTEAITEVVVTDLENSLINITAAPDTIVQGASTQLNATEMDDVVYTWSPATTLSQTNVPDPVATPEVTTTYQLEVSANGCVATRDVEVTVLNPQCEFPFIFVPNAFTPNNDGENDDFRVYGSFIEEMNLIVFNRWGQKVFETNDQQIGWDGTFNGKALPPDAFGYYLMVRCVGGQEYTTKGNVSLLK